MTTTTDRAIAFDRNEDEDCQRGTLGCCIDHKHDDGPCETW